MMGISTPSAASTTRRCTPLAAPVCALYISAICVVPVVLGNQFGVPFYFGGTALLIIVGVSMDLMAQIQAHLVSRQYDDFAQGGGRQRGRLGR